MKLRGDHLEILGWMHRLGGLNTEIHIGYRPARHWPADSGLTSIIGISKTQLKELLSLGMIEEEKNRFNLTSAGRVALGYVG